jgi:undecaprenyl-diphosphatase
MKAEQESKRKLFIGLIVISLFLFLAILYNVLTNGPLLMIDRWISTEIPNIQSPALTELIIFITDINGMLGSAVFSILLIFFLIYKKYYVELKFYLLAFLGASALFVVIKLLVERARPVLKIINEQGFSFPSGHSTMSMVIALSLYFIFADSISSRAGRIVLLVVALLWPILIAFTRVYLNVHWLSDTLAGFSLGIFWVTLVLLFYPYWSHKGKIEFRS